MLNLNFTNAPVCLFIYGNCQSYIHVKDLLIVKQHFFVTSKISCLGERTNISVILDFHNLHNLINVLQEEEKKLKDLNGYKTADLKVFL